MARFRERLQSAPLLWLDGHAYSARLFGLADTVWLDSGAAVSWLRRTQGLLQSDVIAVPLAPVCAQWLVAHPALRAQMAGKSRLLFALKTLLADPALRAHLLELVRALGASFSEPLLLQLPSPRAWIAIAQEQAWGAGERPAIGDEDADSAAMYLADFLRVFGDSAIAALVLQESAPLPPPVAVALECYRPVFNVAAHYRWDVGMQLPAGGIDLAATPVDFAVAPQACDIASGIGLGTDFWHGAAPAGLRPGDFRHAVIPVDALPEAVLARLATLRTPA